MASDRPQPALFWSAVAGCVLMIVGALGTWTSFVRMPHDLTSSGVQGGSDGVVLIFFGVVGGAMLLCYAVVPRLPRWAAIVALVAGALGALLSVIDTIDIASSRFVVGGVDFHISPGWGICLDIVASLVVAGTCVGLTVQATRAGRARAGERAGSALAPPASSTLPPANWYADPWGEARLRYWDGRTWTGHTTQ